MGQANLFFRCPNFPPNLVQGATPGNQDMLQKRSSKSAVKRCPKKHRSRASKSIPPRHSQIVVFVFSGGRTWAAYAAFLGPPFWGTLVFKVDQVRTPKTKIHCASDAPKISAKTPPQKTRFGSSHLVLLGALRIGFLGFLGVWFGRPKAHFLGWHFFGPTAPSQGPREAKKASKTVPPSQVIIPHQQVIPGEEFLGPG